MTIAKWLPPEMEEHKEVFHRCKELQNAIEELCYNCGQILKECTDKWITPEQIVAENTEIDVGIIK